MKTTNEYFDFICKVINNSAQDKKITLRTFSRFDPDYRFVSDCSDLFKDVMQKLIDSYRLDSFDKQKEFVEAHFNKDIIKLLFDYYAFEPNAIQYINSIKDMEQVDNYNTKFRLSGYYSQHKVHMFRSLLTTYDMYFHLKPFSQFVQELNYRDKFYPEENTIPNFFIYAIENMTERSPIEHLNVFIEKFGLEKLCKKNILKDYFTKHNMIDCLNKLENNECSPSL